MYVCDSILNIDNGKYIEGEKKKKKKEVFLKCEL